MLFGTRPEIIKLAPVIQEMHSGSYNYRPVAVSSSQHTDLLQPMLELFALKADVDLAVMKKRQTLNQVAARVIKRLEKLFKERTFAAVVVQGDTTTAMAGALAAFQREIPVVHVEAGLRSGNRLSPYPEELNRQLIARIATLHCAATKRNAEALRAEGIAPETIRITGNPVIDALHSIDHGAAPLGQPRRIVLTTHRRESFGTAMTANLRVLQDFVTSHNDSELIFPVHPNPAVRKAAEEVFGQHPRIRLIDPQPYRDFVRLLRSAWLIVSDSGGIQEEAPSLGKPVIVLRTNTERMEAVEAGWSQLSLNDPERLRQLLHDTRLDGTWTGVERTPGNPFGSGDAAQRIARAVQELIET